MRQVQEQAGCGGDHAALPAGKLEYVEKLSDRFPHGRLIGAWPYGIVPGQESDAQETTTAGTSARSRASLSAAIAAKHFAVPSTPE